MKRFFHIIVVSVLLIGCAKSIEPDVVVIEKSENYHIPQCAKVMMAKTKTMSRTEAIQLQLHPCPYCKPDRL